MAVITIITLLICGKTGSLEYYVSVPFHYNFVFCLTGALGLFMAFSGLKIRSEKLASLICRLSPAMLGVYLIHEHMDISASWTGWLIGTPSEHLGGFLIQLAESVLFIFFLERPWICCGGNASWFWNGCLHVRLWEKSVPPLSVMWMRL